jgi:hypothetical protein
MLLTVAYVVARKRFYGPPLGRDIAAMLNEKMRGRIAIGSIEWPANAITSAVTGGWVPIVVRDVRIWDDCAQNLRTNAALKDATQNQAKADSQPATAPLLPCGEDDMVVRGRDHAEPRKLILQTDLITADIDIHALMFGNHDFVLRHVTVNGGQFLIEQAVEPYPLYPYDKAVVSLLTAFYPAEKPVFHAGIYADRPPPIFDLRDIHLVNVDLYGHFAPSSEHAKRPGYATTIQIHGVNLNADAASNAGFLYMDGRDPLAGKMYLSAPMTSKGGTVRVGDTGAADDFKMGPVPPARTAEYKIDFTDLTVTRLSQLPELWTDDNYVATTLHIDAIAHTKQGAEITLRGKLADYFDRPFAGSWDLRVDGHNLGPTLHDEINKTLSGDNVNATLLLTGPFAALPKLEWSVTGLDATIPFGEGAPGEPAPPPFELALQTLHGAIDLVNEEGHIDETLALVKDTGQANPGQLTLSAKFGLNPYALSNVNIDVVEPINIARFVPAKLKKYTDSFGHFVSGRFSGMGDTSDTFRINEINLFVGRSPTDRLIRAHGGSFTTVGALAQIDVHNVLVDAGASHALVDGSMCTGMYSGRIDRRANDIDDDYIPSRCLVTGTMPPQPTAASSNLSIRDITSKDLGQWLRRLGQAPSVAGIASGRIDVVGDLAKPTVSFDLNLVDVDQIGNLHVGGTMRDGVVDLTKIDSAAFGGSFGGGGRILLSRGAFIERMSFKGKNVDAAKLPGAAGLVSGRIDNFDINVHGDLSRKRDPLGYLDLISGHFATSKLNVKGEQLANVEVCINPGASKQAAQICVRPNADAKAECIENNRQGHSCAVARADRVLGGNVEADINTNVKAASNRGKVPATTFESDISIGGLPVETLALLGPHPTLGGLLASSFRIEGTLDQPVANGFIALERSWLLDQFLGDIALRAEPGQLSDGAAAVVLSGAGLDGQFSVVAKLGTEAPYRVEAQLGMRRLDLDTFANITERAGLTHHVSGWATGTISLRATLGATANDQPPEAWIELTELSAITQQVDNRGRTTPLALVAKPSVATSSGTLAPAVSIRLTPDSLEFACRDGASKTPCPAIFSTPAGDIALRGTATMNNLALAAHGKLDLATVAPLLSSYVGSVAGVAELDGTVGGSVAAPTYKAQIRLDNVTAQPIGQDTTIGIPDGLVQLSNTSLSFTNVRVKVDDPYLESNSELVIKGGIKLDGFKPVTWGVIVEGQIAGKLLAALAPKEISQASGIAIIEDSLTLAGSGSLPNIEATMSFDAKQPLTIIPRGAHREIAFVGGTLSIASTTSTGGNRSYDVTLEDIASSIDGEGRLRNIHGDVAIAEGAIATADITVDAQFIPFRVPGQLDLSLSGQALRGVKPAAKDPWRFSGSISVVNGTFFRELQLNQLLKQAAPVQGSNKPFWELYPDLGNAELDLSIDVGRFAVANGSADIDMDGKLELTGSPRDPRLSGQIKVSRGQFRVPGTRAKFTRTQGAVNFAANRKFPSNTPSLAITSEADFRDQQGQDHLVTFDLRGTLDAPEWDLRTSTGYNKAQTIGLLLFGRTPDKIGRNLGDQSFGVDPSRVDISTANNQGFGDQVVKDLVGDWVSRLFGAPLEKIFSLDVFRFELAFDTIGAHGEKKLLENLRATGDWEQTFRGSTVNGRIELRTPLGFTVQGSYINKDYNDPAEQDIKGFEAKLVYRFYIP